MFTYPEREPLIRKDIIQIIENLDSLRSDGLQNIGITTNGVAFTKKRSLRLKAAGLDTANISLDTLEPMKAEFITRRPKEYHKVITICKKLYFDHEPNCHLKNK